MLFLDFIAGETEEPHTMRISEFIVNAFFIFFTTAFSAWVISAHLTVFIGASFKSLSILYTFLLITISFILLKNFAKRYTLIKIYTNRDELTAILMLAILASVASVISLTAIRPDLDDVNYSSYAVYFLKNYSEPMDFRLHDHWLPGSLPNMPPTNISNTITLLCAYLAFVADIPFLDVYHLYLPALTSAMIPMAWFLVFTKFSNKAIAAALATTAVCIFLSMDGEPHRTFGNFAFVRIWHGKAILMSVVFPVFLAFTIDFFEQPSRENWCKVFILNSAAAGLSVIAVYFMPLAGFLIGSACLTRNKIAINKGKIIESLVSYSMSYVYLAIIAVTILFIAITNFKLVEHASSSGWPDTFMGQFDLVFTNYQFFLFAAFFTVSLIIGNSEDRKFLMSWTALCVVFLLNPLVFPAISNYMTTLNTYWRLFYLMPFPFVIGLPFAYLGRQKTFRKFWWWPNFFFLISIAIVGNSLSLEHATFRKLPLDFGRYKIDKALEQDVDFIINLGNPGPMLAPLKYGEIIPLFSADYPQVVVRKFSLTGYAIQNDLVEEVNRHLRAADFVSGISERGIDDIVYLISQGLMNIVIVSSIKASENWFVFSDYMRNYNFELAGQNDRFCVFTRKQ